MGTLSTHVLDTSAGRPAAGLPIRLTRAEGGKVLGEAVTDADGRVATLGPDVLAPGDYTLTFDTGAWSTGPCFYPRVDITFTVADGTDHYHVPLLLSPYGYSTYRGS